MMFVGKMYVPLRDEAYMIWTECGYVDGLLEGLQLTDCKSTALVLWAHTINKRALSPVHGRTKIMILTDAGVCWTWLDILVDACDPNVNIRRHAL